VAEEQSNAKNSKITGRMERRQAHIPRLSLGGGLRWPLASGHEEEGVRWARMRSSSSLPRRRQVLVVLLLGGPVEMAMIVDLFRGLQGEGEGWWRATSCARTRDGGGDRRQFAMVVMGLRYPKGRPNHRRLR